MFTGYDNKPFIQSVACIISGSKKRIAVFTDPAFDFPRNAYPVPHGNVSYELHVMPAALRVFRKLNFCTLKKPPHTLDGYVLNKVFLLFPGCSGHW